MIVLRWILTYSTVILTCLFTLGQRVPQILTVTGADTDIDALRVYASRTCSSEGLRLLSATTGHSCLDVQMDLEIVH